MYRVGEDPSIKKTGINSVVKEMINTRSICANLPKEPFTNNNNAIALYIYIYILIQFKVAQDIYNIYIFCPFSEDDLH